MLTNIANINVTNDKINFQLQEENHDKTSGIHNFSDSDSKDSLNSSNGKKKKVKNGNKMLR